MQIKTARFDVVEVDEGKIINFPWGIPGFEDLKRYVLLEYQQGPFQWLQAVDDDAVAFPICPPDILGVTYQITEEAKKTIKIEKDEDLLVMNMVSFKAGKDIIRFHMRSPLLFNTASRIACQWVMTKEDVTKNVKLPPGVEWVDEPDDAE